jgi:L-aspartate oxidase
MWREVGVERSAAGLEHAQDEIGRLEQAAGNRPGALANLLLVARLVTTAALARQESRGAHQRSDHPGSSPDWQRHLVFAGQQPQSSAALDAAASC